MSELVSKKFVFNNLYESLFTTNSFLINFYDNIENKIVANLKEVILEVIEDIYMNYRTFNVREDIAFKYYDIGYFDNVEEAEEYGNKWKDDQGWGYSPSYMVRIVNGKIFIACKTYNSCD